MIYLDPGHSGVWPKGDPGVVTKDGKKIESFYTWKYANFVKKYLEERKVPVTLTRTQNEHKVPYSQRTRPPKKDDLFISLHFDTYLGGKKLIYFGQQENSRKLAEKVDKFFGSSDLRASTSSRFGRLYIDDAKCPSILIEVDRIDRATLDEDVMTAFADDVYRGAMLYWGKSIDETDNSGQIEGDNTAITTEFKRVFLVDADNKSHELRIERMSLVGDKLYIAPLDKFKITKV